MLGTASQVQFYTRSHELSELIPNCHDLRGRNSLTRNGLFHTSETEYRFSRLTEYSTPEVFK